MVGVGQPLSLVDRGHRSQSAAEASKVRPSWRRSPRHAFDDAFYFGAKGSAFCRIVKIKVRVAINERGEGRWRERLCRR
jgi:hypothetical protein